MRCSDVVLVSKSDIVKFAEISLLRHHGNLILYNEVAVTSSSLEERALL
jgi:hypothetical protein